MISFGSQSRHPAPCAVGESVLLACSSPRPYHFVAQASAALTPAGFLAPNGSSRAVWQGWSFSMQGFLDDQVSGTRSATT